MELFHPELELIKESDCEFTLRAATMTPNGCYTAGRIEEGVPPTVRIVPEVKPVLLHIQKQDVVCTQALKAVHHQISDLEVGEGQTMVTAFAMLDGELVGTASIDVQECKEDSQSSGLLETSDWHAWANLMPPGPFTLHVHGNVTLASPAYSVELIECRPGSRGQKMGAGQNAQRHPDTSRRPDTPPGQRDQVLELKLEVRKREGIFPQVVINESVRFSTDYEGKAERVRILLPDGKAIELVVEKAY